MGFCEFRLLRLYGAEMIRKGRWCLNVYLLFCQAHLSGGSLLPVFLTRGGTPFPVNSPDFLCFPQWCHFLTFPQHHRMFLLEFHSVLLLVFISRKMKWQTIITCLITDIFIYFWSLSNISVCVCFFVFLFSQSSKISLGSKALSHDSVFVSDSSEANEPLGASQDSIHGKVKSLQVLIHLSDTVLLPEEPH